MAAGKPILGVLEEGSEIRWLVEESGCGKCCEPGDYVEVAGLIRWYIEHAGTSEIERMGLNGRRYLESNLTKNLSIGKYIESILVL